MSNTNIGNDKSILQKIADTVKDIAAIATDAANDALKAEAPTRKAREAVVTDVPLAGLGLVSDPMMVPPMALAPARKRQRAATKPAAKKAAKEFVGLAKKSAAGKSRKAAKKTTKKTAKKTKKSAVKKTAKKARKSKR